ncbi:unnamed protein product [Lymnaea stagnalis]|uniref:Apoptosis regulator Bcl-2 family BH4 domain-containing protein n=1 Tax=Lymnaea stagnalis TaxID=6523 RepID=A0AAV2HNE8_LYMST
MVKKRDVLPVNDSPQIMELDNTRSIVADYIRYRLEFSGYHWENDGRQGNVQPNPVQRAMRDLGDEFEQRFSTRFDDLVKQLHLTDENAHDVFSTVVAETFVGGVNWGRIVALFGFSGRFAVHCFESNKPHLVDNVVEWVTTYVETNLRNWMSTHNNWQGFLEFQSRGADRLSDSQWPNFKTIVSCAAAGLGVLTLGAFLAQKS